MGGLAMDVFRLACVGLSHSEITFFPSREEPVRVTENNLR